MPFQPVPVVLGLALGILTSIRCLAATYQPSSQSPPPVSREFRAAWVATVANIDWPSTNATTTAQQKSELVAILDRAAQLKLNAIIFQVRPACDALYVSSLEPWSEYLTGTMGKAPEPSYDPLAYAVAEAHKRGLELHAWFNPYRAHHAAAKSPVSANHVSKTHPELVRHYGRSLWLDPGEKAVQDYTLSVVLDVLRRYDIDGVHFDDYFYPYKEQDASGKELDFPDEASWQRYGAGGKLSRDDWRRDNVDTLVRRVYQGIKAAKPWVKFGISPFGIWRPGNPAQIQGFDAYAKLYADSRKWLVNGWVDYFVPQLYWAIDAREQSFPVLLNWWSAQNPKGRLLMAGMDSTKTFRRWQPGEIVNQIALTRKQAGVNGHVHWNMGALMRNQRLDTLLESAYAQPALVPPERWLSRKTPSKPSVSVRATESAAQISWACAGEEPVWQWVLQTRTGKVWNTSLLPGGQTSAKCESEAPEVIALTAVDRYGNSSRPAVLRRAE